MMGVAEIDKCRILITMRFKVQPRWAQENQNTGTSVSQVQGRRASEKKCKIYFLDIVVLLKINFFS